MYDTQLERVLDYGYMKFEKKGTVDDRLREATHWLGLILPPAVSIDLVAYEKMFTSGNGADAPLAVFAYLIRNRCYATGIPVLEIPHTSAYLHAIGKGNATKEEVKSSLESRFQEEFPNTDISDAVAIALGAITYRPKEKKPKTRKS
jgi:Holliday junction resolvasome RuvABC endonuclease subunit